MFAGDGLSLVAMTADRLSLPGRSRVCGTYAVREQLSDSFAVSLAIEVLLGICERGRTPMFTLAGVPGPLDGRQQPGYVTLVDDPPAA